MIKSNKKEREEEKNIVQKKLEKHTVQEQQRNEAYDEYVISKHKSHRKEKYNKMYF